MSTTLNLVARVPQASITADMLRPGVFRVPAVSPTIVSGQVAKTAQDAGDLLLLVDSVSGTLVKQTRADFILAIQGETNTASNIGSAGIGVYDRKVGVDLQFRSLRSLSSNLTLTLNTVDGTIDFNFIPQTVPALVGATGVAAGAAGSVPAPAAGQQTLFLRGDATWALPAAFSTAAPGLVPAPLVADATKFLRGDGTWQDVPNPVPYTAVSVGTGSGIAILKGQFGQELQFRRIASLDPAVTVSLSADQVRVSLVPNNIPIFTTTERGVAPPTVNNTQTRYLRDDGTWAPPSPAFSPIWYSKALTLDATMPNDVTYEHPFVFSVLGQMVSRIKIDATSASVPHNMIVRVAATKDGSPDIIVAGPFTLNSTTPVVFQEQVLHRIPAGYQINLWLDSNLPFNQLTGGTLRADIEIAELPA